MLTLKNFKRKFLQSHSSKSSLTPNDDESSSSSSSRNHLILDKNQVKLLAEWLDQLNAEKLIAITDQNDIVIQAGGENDQIQQIFVNRSDIDTYMERKTFGKQTSDETQLISMSDLARILLAYGYVHEISGQLSFTAHTVASDSNELKWLRSIVHHAQPDYKCSQTHVKLFDGENTQLFSIPYEYMAPTNDTQTVAQYLFQNGQIRYDVDTASYVYRYVQPDLLLDEKIKSPERISQHQLLSFHIQDIHADQKNKRVQLSFRYEPNENLILPSRWYDQLLSHRFDRDYIIDILLANGGVINENTFVFLGRTYSLREHQINSSSTSFQRVNFSLKEKNDLIRQYVHLIMQMDGVKQDQTNQLLVLENHADGRKLYFTPSHSTFIQQNGFQRQDVIQILTQYSQIKQDQYQKWILNYNHQSVRLPSSIIPSQHLNNRAYSAGQPYRPKIEQICSLNRTSSDHEKDYVQPYDRIINYMCRHGLITWDKSSDLIKLHFADQTLLLPVNHLRSNTASRRSSSASTNANLPFTSRQLSQWLRNNSYITRQNSRRSSQ